MMGIKLIRTFTSVSLRALFAKQSFKKIASAEKRPRNDTGRYSKNRLSVLSIKALLFLSVGITFSFVAQPVLANNFAVKNFTVYSTDTSANRITFSCDLSWDNSWKTTTNNDAAWVFLKYSTDSGLNWSHARMSAVGTNPSGFSASANFEIIVPADAKGFFLQRTDLNTGNVSAKGVRFVWNYGDDGLSDEAAMAANTINKIFGVEMVYIPAGSFNLGDGNSSSEFRFKQGSADNDPWYVQSEAAITTTNTAADGYYYQSSGASGESSSGDTFLLSASFPKGYQAFYMMKYELTEGQWVSFFNTLSPEAKLNRDVTSAAQGGKNSDGVVNRNTISWDSTKPRYQATTTRPDRAMSYLSWPDLLSYSDWAALRPVTEMEFEKMARGKDVSAVANELAWGKDSSSINGALATEITPNNSDEDGLENIWDGSANINNNNLSWTTGDGRVGGVADGQMGPLRVGIFAEGSTNRVTSGAGYYGNMDLSGNLSEMFVTIGRPQGRQFLGSHGDGQLSTIVGYEGNATNIDWPGIDASDSSRGATGTVGSGYRGGDFKSANSIAYQISNRSFASKDPDSLGYAQRNDPTFGIAQGGRLGRSAP